MAHTQCGWSSCLVKPHIKVRISNFARGAIQRLRPDLQAGSQATDENCSPPYCQSKTESYVLSNGQSGHSCLPFPPRGNLSVQKCWVRDCPHTKEERGWSLILILWFPHCHDLTCLYSIHIHSEMCYLFGKTPLLFMDFSLPDNNLRADWSVHSINEYGWSKKSFFKNGWLCKAASIQEVSQKNTHSQTQQLYYRLGLSSLLLPSAGRVPDSTVVFFMCGINQSIRFRTPRSFWPPYAYKLLSNPSCQRRVRTQAGLE